MLEFKIPGFGKISVSYLLLDFNGTLATSGKLIGGVAPRLKKLAENLELHVITGDSFGTAIEELDGINCHVTILPTERQMDAKKDYIKQFTAEHTIAIGNGRNDQFMLNEAIVGIAVIGEEGAAVQTMNAADIVTPSINVALDLLLYPRHLVATLRS